MEIIPYSDDYFDSLVAFLRVNWAQNHSVYNRELFDWQYGGPDCDRSSCVLLIDDGGSIAGFLGTICYPFVYDNTIKKAAGLAIWIIDKNIKNSGIGLHLRKAVEEKYDVVFTIGINHETIRYYQKRGYNYYDSLHRYIAPLDVQGYQYFLAQPCGETAIRKWVNDVELNERSIEPAAGFDAVALENAYKQNVVPNFKLLPQKNASFWQWRYLESKGFSYLFYQGGGGIVIFREESVHAPGDEQRHGLKCLRIIEIIPSNGSVWNGADNPELVSILSSVLSWARERGCVLADFQISTSRIGHILESVGFRLQQESGETNAVRLFSPFRANASALNFVYRVMHEGDFASIDRDYVYLTKSDTDMDRPNWPGVQ